MGTQEPYAPYVTEGKGWSDDRAFARGLLQAGLLAAFLGAGAGLLAWSAGPDGVVGVPAMMLPGTALLATLQTRIARRQGDATGGVPHRGRH